MPRSTVRTEVKGSLNLPTDQVKVIDTNELVSSINEKKAVKEQASTVEAPDYSEMVRQAIESTAAIQAEKLEAELKAKELEVAKVLEARESAHQAELESYKALVEGLKAQTEEQISKVSADLNSTKSELSKVKESEQKFADVFKLHGFNKPAREASKTPALNVVTTTRSDTPIGAHREFQSLLDNAPKVLKSTSTGNPVIVTDTKLADRFVTENRAAVIRDLEVFARANGLLQGKNPSPMAVKEASTQISDISGGFLSTLSSIVRTTKRPGYVFWQFAQTEFDYLKGHGSTVLVQRSAYSATSTTPSDWLLSGGGSFAYIDTTYQQIQTGTVPIILQEYGLGKIGSALQPISIPSFVLAYSMIDLVSVLERNLGQNYANFEDLTIRSLFAGTSVRLYNSKGSVLTSPTTIAASADPLFSGVITKEFLVNLYAYMLSLQVEKFPDGNYALVLNPIAAAQFVNSLQTLYRFVQKEDIEALSQILNPGVIEPENGSRIAGYLGSYYGFHVFQSNAFSVGAVGTEGVQNETINSATTLTRTSYAFGKDAVGRGVGTPMEIRQNEITNYQRINQYIWRSEEGFAALDVDPTGYSDASAVPQQLRVFQIRTTDTAL
jgi:hypothetical protein